MISRTIQLARTPLTSCCFVCVRCRKVSDALMMRRSWMHDTNKCVAKIRSEPEFRWRHLTLSDLTHVRCDVSIRAPSDASFAVFPSFCGVRPSLGFQFPLVVMERKNLVDAPPVFGWIRSITLFWRRHSFTATQTPEHPKPISTTHRPLIGTSEFALLHIFTLVLCFPAVSKYCT